MASVNPGLSVDYTSKDYQGFMDSMLEYATLAFPEWSNQNPGGLEMMLLESFAREMDVLSYYGDRTVAEAYISTATQLSSVIRLATLLGYVPGQPIASTGTVTFQTDDTQTDSIVVPSGTQVTTVFVTSLGAPIVFETVADVTVPSAGGTAPVNVIQGETQGTTSFDMGIFTGNTFTLLVEPLGISDGTILQSFSLENNPVVGGSITVWVENPSYNPDSLTNTSDPVTQWFEVSTLMDAVDTDTVWTSSTDEDGVVTINFGDNINGAVPAAGLNVYAGYRVGGGVLGNLAANQVVDIASAVAGVSVASSTAMTGGADAETIDQIRNNAPRAYRTQNRAVTLQDFGDLALGVASISQAKAIANNYNNVTVYCLATGNTIPTQGLLDVTTRYLQERAMVGATVTAQAASTFNVNITVNVGCEARFNADAMKLRVTQAIQGLFEASATTLGMRIPVSLVYSTINAIPGVSYVTVTTMTRADFATSVSDIFARDWEIPKSGTITVTTSTA
ncbi:baseplate protein [Streptomyces phage BRock]|uniref:Baseplate assembly protein n=1 Tax=Streptomyces phage BRock TaxID=1913591 RepID=A0A1J0GW37_9CAUD|nr:baseplate protein [Streptomyces phage BRock]APC46390.1 baseplate assembly protein [Streptomyces phage BRock]